MTKVIFWLLDIVLKDTCESMIKICLFTFSIKNNTDILSHLKDMKFERSNIFVITYENSC